MSVIANIGRENENRYRSYPFSESSVPVDDTGVPLGSDVFVDAFVCLSGVSGSVMLTRLDFQDGVVELSDGSGVIAVGEAEPASGEILLYQGARYAGCLSCGDGYEREMLSGRSMSFGKTAVLCPSCVVSIPAAKVMSVSVPLVSVSADAPTVELRGTAGGRLVARASKGRDGVFDMWFDVLPRTDESVDDTDTGIRKIIAASEAGSLFTVDEGDLPGSSAYVSIPTMTREDVCARAHLSDDIMQVSDTCFEEDATGGGTSGNGCNPEELPDTGPSEVEMSGCAVDFMAYDLPDYPNPLKFSVVFGMKSFSGLGNVGVGASVEDVVEAASKASTSSAAHGNGIEISIPGGSHA